MNDFKLRPVIDGMTPVQRARFIIGAYDSPWSKAWLSGKDRTYESAIAHGNDATDALVCFATGAAAGATIEGSDVTLKAALSFCEMFYSIGAQKGHAKSVADLMLADWAAEAIDKEPGRDTPQHQRPVSMRAEEMGQLTHTETILTEIRKLRRMRHILIGMSILCVVAVALNIFMILVRL